MTMAFGYLKFLLLLTIGVKCSLGKNPVSFMRAAMSTVQTPNDLVNLVPALFAYDRSLFVFRVKACNDAHIYLYGRVGPNLMNTDISIGGWGNTRSAIRIYPKEETGNLVMVKATPDILNCHEMRTFWLSWKYDRIWVGRGPIYGQQTFLDFNRTVHGYTHSVNAVRLGTGYGASGVWQFAENQVDFLSLFTPPAYGYNSLWKTVQQKFNVMFFEVMACHSANIAMSPVVGNWRRAAYEVVIGGWDNTRSVIRLRLQGGSPRASLNMTGLLNCNYYKPFWVGWRNNIINVGKGYIYNEQEMLRWQVPVYSRWPVRSLGFSTFEGAEGRWLFPENTEPAFVFHTPTDPNFNKTFVLVPRQTHFRFEVQTCTSALLYISPNRSPLRRDVIYIGLGFNQNRRYYIKMDDVTYAEGTYESYLDCERFRLIWISWEGGLIRVGHGGMVDRDATIQWQSPYPVIFSVGFRSPESVAHWRIRSDQVDNARVVTEPADFNARPHGVIWVDQQLIKSFNVRGCSSASIALLNSHAWVNSRAIEVTIGAENNQKVVIAQATDGGDVLAEASTPDILKCGQTNVFWISWVGFNINVGYGWIYGKNTIVSTAMVANYNIQALRVRGASDRLIWRFPGDPGDYVLRNTLGDLRYEWMRPHEDRKWMNFWVQACSSIAVVLSPQYSMEPDLVYEIGLDWGSESVTYIKKDGTVKVQMTNLRTGLDCNTPRPFWVSWENGAIKLGTGNAPGFAQVITWTDMEPRDIRSIGITSAEGQMAEWKIRSNDLFESTSVIDPNVGPSKYWATVRHRQSLQLKIKTCKEFHIIMTTILGMDNTSLSYTLELGTNDGSISRLRTGGQVQVSAYAPYIFNCDEERDIWLSWANGVVMVGKGLQFGRSMFLNFNDIDPIVIHALGFASYDNQPARMRMLHDEVEFATVEVSGPGGLSGGQIVGVVIGVLLLVVLFSGAVYIIYRPPELVRRIVCPQKTPMPTARASSLGLGKPFQNDE